MKLILKVCPATEDKQGVYIENLDNETLFKVQSSILDNTLLELYASMDKDLVHGCIRYHLAYSGNLDQSVLDQHQDKSIVYFDSNIEHTDKPSYNMDAEFYEKNIQRPDIKNKVLSVHNTANDIVDLLINNNI